MAKSSLYIGMMQVSDMHWGVHKWFGSPEKLNYALYWCSGGAAPPRVLQFPLNTSMHWTSLYTQNLVCLIGCEIYYLS